MNVRVVPVFFSVSIGKVTLFGSRRLLLLFDLFRLLDQSILRGIPDGCLSNSRELMPFQRWNVLGVAIGVGGARGGGEKQQEKLANEHLVFTIRWNQKTRKRMQKRMSGTLTSVTRSPICLQVCPTSKLESSSLIHDAETISASHSMKHTFFVSDQWM